MGKRTRRLAQREQRRRTLKVEWDDRRVQRVITHLTGTWSERTLQRRIHRQFPQDDAALLKRVTRRIASHYLRDEGWDADEIARYLSRLARLSRL
jgi:hypothetical protein